MLNCTSSNLRRRHLLVGTLGAAAVAAWPAYAASYPSRPVKLVLGFPPGGPNDIVARLLAQRLGDLLKQPFVVENRPGATGAIASQLVATAPADGYTLLYNSSTYALAAALRPSLPFDPVKDLVPVAATVAAPMVFVVNAALPIHNVDDFIAYAKARPGKVAYATGGNGSITHVPIVQLAQHSGLDVLSVPYKGSAPAMLDVAAGVAQFAIDATNSALPFVKDARMRAIAVTSRKRLAILPDVPTIGEQWLPGYEALAWQGIMAPARTPPEIVAQLNRAINQSLAQESMRRSMAEMGIDIISGTPQDYAALVTSEISRWTLVGKQAGIKLD